MNKKALISGLIFFLALFAGQAHAQSEGSRLSNKTALVTGAASGNGKAIATLFAREKAKVVLVDINKSELEKVAGHEITNDAIQDAIKVFNESRAVRREFVKLANDHCDVITPTKRSAVLKAYWFMEKPAYTAKLKELNEELKKLPVCDWKGTKVVTSGIICDNPNLLVAFEENNIAIAADDVAHESRAFRVDVPFNPDPMMALAEQFAAQDYDVLLYDPESSKNRRGEFVANMVKESGAQGLVLFMQQFCDPEEMEYPYLKKALDDAGIPHIKLGIDQQMRDFGQARTAIQAFADVLSMQ